MSDLTPPRKVRCPECGAPASIAPDNAFRPFCSERCRLLDLGEWADGKYAIPVAAPSEFDPDAEAEANGANQGGETGDSDEQEAAAEGAFRPHPLKH